jgi:hypothetical protein
MIDEVGNVLGWERKHTTKALNGKVSLGLQAKKRGSRPFSVCQASFFVFFKALPPKANS